MGGLGETWWGQPVDRCGKFPKAEWNFPENSGSLEAELSVPEDALISVCTCEFTSDADRHEYKHSLTCQLRSTKSVQRKAMTCLTRSEQVGVVCPTLAQNQRDRFHQ